MTTNIKQFKLTNNEEIVCEVHQWPDEDSESMEEKNLHIKLIRYNYEQSKTI